MNEIIINDCVLFHKIQGTSNNPEIKLLPV